MLVPDARLGADGRATDAAFSSDGRYIVVAEDGDIGLWRVADKKFIRQYKNDDNAYSVAFSSDDSIYMGGENAIRRVSLTGDPLGSFETGDFYAEPVVSPDGQYLVSNTTSSSGRNLRVWDVRSGERMTPLEVEPPTDPNYGYSYTLAFDDEQNLYVASGYGEVTRHNLNDGTFGEACCEPSLLPSHSTSQQPMWTELLTTFPAPLGLATGHRCRSTGACVFPRA